jgi:hypothetical protein
MLMRIPKVKTSNNYRWFNRFFRSKWVDANQRIKMLQIVLQYTLPRMKQDTNEVSEDLPLFIE